MFGLSTKIHSLNLCLYFIRTNCKYCGLAVIKEFLSLNSLHQEFASSMKYSDPSLLVACYQLDDPASEVNPILDQSRTKPYFNNTIRTI